jgi:hypothetical protein
VENDGPAIRISVRPSVTVVRAVMPVNPSESSAACWAEKVWAPGATLSNSKRPRRSARTVRASPAMLMTAPSSGMPRTLSYATPRTVTTRPCALPDAESAARAMRAETSCEKRVISE